jgi:long-chain fatty acid transport protein
MGRRIALRVTLVFTGLLMMPTAALAGGFEYQATGAPALGRGGAYAAGVDDPFALLTNPAQLSAVPGMQLAGGVNLAFYNSCFARAGNYPAGGQAWSGEAYPQVCNGAAPFPAPHIVFAFQPIEKLGIGVGILPPAGIANVRYGRDDGTMLGPDGDPWPTPSRYLLLERNTPLFFPTIGASYEVLPWLRVGASFGWGIALTSFATTISGFGTEDPFADVTARASGADTFVPRVGGSVNMTPHDNLDIMLGFMWTRDIRSSVDLELDNDLLPEAEKNIDGATLITPQPWQLSFGIRYADRIRPRDTPAKGGRLLDGRVNDRMTNERWDIELNVVYERNSNVDYIRVAMPVAADGTRPSVLGNELDDVILPQNWRDQIVFRLGGDYNVVPGVLALRGGLSFETNGVTRGFEQLSFRPGQRVGVHGGFTYRIAHRVDVVLAYAHIFEQTIDLTMGEAQLEADSPLGDEGGFTTNAGRFSSHYNVVSLGLNAYF